jgi:hypothetical protein
MTNPKRIVPSELPVGKSSLAARRRNRRDVGVHRGMTSRSEKDATPVHPRDMRA